MTSQITNLEVSTPVLPRQAHGTEQGPSSPCSEGAAPTAPYLDEPSSPSRANCVLSCSAKYYYKYKLELPDVQGSARAIGKALHATSKENFTQKLETKKDLSIAAAVAFYRDAWLEEEQQTEFQKDEDRAELRAMGAKLVAKFMETTAPLIQPAAVELPVQGVIAGVRVRGYVDLLDVQGRIIDLKSANKSPSKNVIRPDYRFQVSTYAQLTPGASGEAELHTIVKLQKEVRIVPQSFKVTPADKQYVETIYPLAQEIMASGIVVPNRNHFLCSTKYCPYWRQCVADFGGQVSGADE